MVEVSNITKSRVVCDAEEAKTFLSRTKGLMFRKKIEKDKGLLIRFSSQLKSASIHSFFMRFPLDLIFIGEDMRVVDLKTLSPWRVYNPKKKCAYVLEVRKGTIEEKGIEIGDLLKFKI